MFFEGDRIMAMREMILAKDTEGRKKALAKLLPLQRSDFEGLYRAMAGKPVTIRLLDPPLHEFLPQDESSQKELAQALGVSLEEIRGRVESLHELNPMLGHRGCRLSITYPEICEMQTRAIIEAAANVKKEGVRVLPEIMIPVVSEAREIAILRKVIDHVAREVFLEKNVKIPYSVGTMIELPRACIRADDVAREAEFFSFGTNDLTQTAFGFSRDDVGTFVPYYVKSEILQRDPFQVLDQEGVGELVKMGIERGRRVRPNLKIGICGEHGGEPESVKFCHRVGMDYVSCSPFRVPIARLAAAQAVIEEEEAKRRRGRKIGVSLPRGE
jgi:pyruvate,orthophosphate dikinase